MTLTSSLIGPNEFVIDPLAQGDASGVVIIRGNLQVNGTTTTVNSNEVDISDISLKLASNTSSLANLDSAGIELGSSSNVTFQYEHNTTSWLSNKEIIGPSQNPSRAYALANKAYVDSKVGAVRNTDYVASSSLQSDISSTVDTWIQPSSYSISIQPASTDKIIKISMNIGYITSWEADQTISFKVGRSINSGTESTIVQD